MRGGSRLDLQRRVLRLGKPPRRWRKPKWAAEALWEPPVLHIEAAPIVSGVGTGCGVRNRFAPLLPCVSMQDETCQWPLSYHTENQEVSTETRCRQRKIKKHENLCAQVHVA